MDFFLSLFDPTETCQELTDGSNSTVSSEVGAREAHVLQVHVVMHFGRKHGTVTFVPRSSSLSAVAEKTPCSKLGMRPDNSPNGSLSFRLFPNCVVNKYDLHTASSAFLTVYG